MNKQPTRGLGNLPTELRDLFHHSTSQIRKFDGALSLTEFTFLTNEILFLVDMDDEREKALAVSGRDLIYEAFHKERDYVDGKISELERNREDYLQRLYAQGLIYLWTSLETLVRRLLAGLIEYDSEILTTDPFSKLSIPVADYFRLAPKERATYLAGVIMSGVKCGDRRGVERFECILDAFGLAGPLKPQHKRRILALHHLRNCIVHNDSVADVALCKYSPWLGYDLGDKIVITAEDFHNYVTSILAYSAEMFYRLNKGLGAPERFLRLLREKVDRLGGATAQS